MRDSMPAGKSCFSISLWTLYFSLSSFTFLCSHRILTVIIDRSNRESSARGIVLRASRRSNLFCFFSLSLLSLSLSIFYVNIIQSRNPKELYVYLYPRLMKMRNKARWTHRTTRLNMIMKLNKFMQEDFSLHKRWRKRIVVTKCANHLLIFLQAFLDDVNCW